MSTEKASTLTLRLTAEEAEALEQLKRITGKRTGSEAIKYIVKEYPRFVSNYKQQADKHRDVEQKYDRLCHKVDRYFSALDDLQAESLNNDGKFKDDSEFFRKMRLPAREMIAEC